MKDIMYVLTAAECKKHFQSGRNSLYQPTGTEPLYQQAGAGAGIGIV